MLEPWLLLQSILVGIAVAAPVGPMSLLCMQRTLHAGPGAGLGVRRRDRRGGRLLRRARGLRPDRRYLAAHRRWPMVTDRGRIGAALFRGAHPARTAGVAGTPDHRALALARFRHRLPADARQSPDDTFLRRLVRFALAIVAAVPGGAVHRRRLHRLAAVVAGADGRPRRYRFEAVAARAALDQPRLRAGADRLCAIRADRRQSTCVNFACAFSVSGSVSFTC